MFQYRLYSPQVKRSVISSTANLLHDLPNDVRLRILGNKEILAKSQVLVKKQPSAQYLPPPTPRIQTRPIAVKKLAKIDIKFFLSCPYWMSLLCPKYFAQDCRTCKTLDQTKLRKMEMMIDVFSVLVSFNANAF